MRMICIHARRFVESPGLETGFGMMRNQSGPTDRTAHVATQQGPGQRPRHRSEALLAGAREVVIEHRGQDYLLRLTSSGKLILTK